MTPTSDPPLDPPPRHAHLRRGIRNLRRAYRTVFALVIVVFGGWVVMDVARWHELPTEARFLTVSFGIVAVLALATWRFVENPLGRDLRLARHGVAAQGQIVAIGKPRGRRGIVKITYSFQTAAGAIIEGACSLPRRFPVGTLEPGTAISVLYDPNRPRVHKPRLVLDAVEFGEGTRRKSPGA